MFRVLFLLFLAQTNAFPLIWKCKMLDLTHDLSNTTTVTPTTTLGFKLETLMKGMTGPVGRQTSVYVNSFAAVEHISTHMDAPSHWSRTMEIARKARNVDQVPLTSLVGEACVMDIPEEHKNNKDYQLTVQDVQNWEEKNGKVHADCIVLIRTGQSKLWGNATNYLGMKGKMTQNRYTTLPENMHWPGMDWKTVQWILDNRDLKAFGMDALSLDYGARIDFHDSVHTVLLGSGRPGFENLADLSKLPPRGATLIALPMYIKYGSGAPTRVMAVGWDGEDDKCRISGAEMNRLDALIGFVCLAFVYKRI